MKPITWLRKLTKHGHRGYPMATLMFYGPDDRKASKAVLGIFASRGAEPHLHKWFRDSPNADLRYDVGLQNACLEIMRREGVRSLAMLEAINGCPHEEGVDYPLGQVCPECPFWANRQRPVEPPGAFDADGPRTMVESAIAVYKREQWGELLADAADREKVSATWEEWYANLQEVTAELEARGARCRPVLLDIEEIKQYCREQGVPNNGAARASLAARRAQQDIW
ncbi:MAG: hypothetical protein JO015_16025 [Verrucomicrobia bacterium]|nr:hypothetical protein [Verrucomicrobiota bacterium]